MPVSKVSTVRQVHPQDLIAVIESSHQHRHIGLRSRMRLDVRVPASEYLLYAIDREVLNDIRKLAPAIVPLARITLGVLVRKRRAHRLQHRLRYEILRRDQL